MKIFKTQIPVTILFDLLNKVSTEYIIDKVFFKKLRSFIPDFLHQCDPYYLESQKKYIKKNPFLYKSFLTVVRQICNSNEIPFSYNLKYMHSTYEIVYYVNFQKGVHS